MVDRGCVSHPTFLWASKVWAAPLSRHQPSSCEVVLFFSIFVFPQKPPVELHQFFGVEPQARPRRGCGSQRCRTWAAHGGLRGGGKYIWLVCAVKAQFLCHNSPAWNRSWVSPQIIWIMLINLIWGDTQVRQSRSVSGRWVVRASVRLASRAHCWCFDLRKGPLIGDLETSYSLSLAFGCTLQIVVSLSNNNSAKKRHQHKSTIWILWVPNVEIYRSYTHVTHVGLRWEIRVSQLVHRQQQEKANPVPNAVLLGSPWVSWLIICLSSTSSCVSLRVFCSVRFFVPLWKGFWKGFDN